MPASTCLVQHIVVDQGGRGTISITAESVRCSAGRSRGLPAQQYKGGSQTLAAQQAAIADQLVHIYLVAAQLLAENFFHLPQLAGNGAEKFRRESSFAAARLTNGVTSRILAEKMAAATARFFFQ